MKHWQSLVSAQMIIFFDKPQEGTADQPAGIGQGLQICQQTIRFYDTMIRVEIEVGVNTRITISLPLTASVKHIEA